MRQVNFDMFFYRNYYKNTVQFGMDLLDMHDMFWTFDMDEGLNKDVKEYVRNRF